MADGTSCPCSDSQITHGDDYKKSGEIMQTRVFVAHNLCEEILRRADGKIT